MKIAFYGLGKLGLPYAALLADKGHKVIGIDVNNFVRQTVHDGHVPDAIREPGLPELVKRVVHGAAKGRLTIPLGEPDGAAKGAEASIILVPTPSLPDGAFSIEYVLSAIRTIGRLIKGQDTLHTVLLVSTVSPGSTGGPIRRALEMASQRYVGIYGVQLFYNPEFVQLGNVLEGMKKPFAHLLGEQDLCSIVVVKELLVGEAEIVPMTWEEAELAKLCLNCALSLKPVLANTLAPICNYYGADVDVVTEFIGMDPRVGSKLLRAGLHPGGPCLPRDIRALENAGNKVLFDVPLARTIDRLGREEITLWVEFLGRLFARHFGSGSLRDVGILGLNFKPGVLVREEAFGDRLANALENLYPGCHTRSFDSTEQSGDMDRLDRIIEYSVILVLTLMDPKLKEVLESGVDLKNKVVVDPWRYLDRNKLHCLAYYGGLE